MRTPRLLLATLVALVVTGPLLLAAPADAVPLPGTLSVTAVDENGDPMPGYLLVYVDDGAGGETLVQDQKAVSSWSQQLTPGTYGVVLVSPWGGIQCRGFTVCNYALIGSGSGVALDGSVSVASSQTTTVTVTGEKPFVVAGTPAVGNTLSVEWSDGMQGLIALLDGRSPPRVAWLRNGSPITGATHRTYKLTPQDAGRSLTARASYGGFGLTLLEDYSGATVLPRTSSAAKVPKVATRATAVLARNPLPAGSRGAVRVDVLAKRLTVTGKVRISVGGWSVVRPLRRGTARTALPALGPGEYRVEARYLGSRTFLPATAAPRTLTVTR